jgi:protein TonB
MKNLIIFPFLILTMKLYCQIDENDKMIISNDTNKAETAVVNQATTMPMFRGGEKRLIKFISDNLKYPKTAKGDNVEGKVIVRFCILPTGEVGDVSIVRGIRQDLDNAAIEVVKKLPNFIPGTINGKPVPVYFSIPITFTQ